jgi:hypothetical protein
MLKPAQPAMPSGNGDERPVGELVHQLVEQGKSYAQAELGVAKAIAASKAQGFKVPAILLASAFLLLQAAFTVLAVGVALALVPPMGPLLAGLVAFLIFAGLAGGLAYLAVKKIGSAQ